MSRQPRAIAIRLALATAMSGALVIGPAAISNVQITSTPALSPAFNPGVTDYVVRCSATVPLHVKVSSTNPATTFVVDGFPVVNGNTAPVGLKPGQSFTVSVAQNGAPQNYYVRCLPAGFPSWTSQQPGVPQSDFYVVAPSFSTGFFQAARYIAIVDRFGVPLWWTLPPSPNRPVDAKLLPDGDILWTDMAGVNATYGNTAEEQQLDGSIVDSSIVPVCPGCSSNAHEVQRLPDGNDLVIGGYTMNGVNLSAIGGSSSASIHNDVVQEVTPAGTPVWTWDAFQHVGLTEVDPQWRSTAVSGAGVHDIYHINSAVTDANGNVLISLRYTDAIFFVNAPGGPGGGSIRWKLGGSTRAESLSVHGDAVFPPTCLSNCGFGGQHYARFFDAGDGKLYVTLHDNGTGRNRAPRGVRYQIDEAGRTATLVEKLADVAAPNLRSACCGSAQKLPGGNWVVSWGANPIVAELTSAGTRVFVLNFSGAYSYRAQPVLPGAVTRDALRAGMNAQYPR